jgi:hypothetical protein
MEMSVRRQEAFVALSSEALQRLAQLGYTTDTDLRHWEEMWQSAGESSFWDYLRKSEEVADEYRRWFPRLQAYARECRLVDPPLAIESYTAAEREQHRILLAKMQEFTTSEDRHCVFNRKPHQAAILSTTRIGLPAAQAVFGGSGAVILEESERERWFNEVYQPADDSFWWYAFAWWTVREGLEPEDEANMRQHYPIAEGSSYWLVVLGVHWGWLAGGKNSEYYQWDGIRAKSTGLCCIGSY